MMNLKRLARLFKTTLLMCLLILEFFGTAYALEFDGADDESTISTEVDVSEVVETAVVDDTGEVEEITRTTDEEEGVLLDEDWEVGEVNDAIISGLVHREVSSWATLLGAMADRTVDVIDITANFAAPNSTGWHQIGLTTLPAGHGSTAGNGSGSARELIINGHGHTVNFNDWAITYNNNNITGAGARRNGWHITWQNLDSFGTNIWGFTTYNDLSTTNQQNSVMVYENVSHRGSQLIHSPAGQVIMRGIVQNHVVANHVPPFNTNHNRPLTTLQAHQGNVHVQNLLIDEGATLNLSVLHAGSIDLMSGGTLRLREGATLNIEGSSNTSTNATSGAMDEARGINIQIRAGGNLIVENGAQINLRPKPTFSAISMLGSGSNVHIEVGGAINIDTAGFQTATAQGETNNLIHMGAGATLEIDGELNITSNNTTGGASLMRLGASAAGGTASVANRTTLNVRGALNIEASNMGSSTASLIHFGNPTQISPNANGGNFIVHPGGHLNLISDSNSVNHHLIYFNAGLTAANASIFEFRNAEYINLQRLGTMPVGSGLIGMNGTVGNLRLDIQDVSLWNSGNLSVDADFNWMPLFAARVLYNGANATTAGGIINARTTNILGGFGLTVEASNHFNSHFRTQNTQRITMGFIPDVDVSLQNGATDGARSISGTGTPGAYLRLTDDPFFIFSEEGTNTIISPVEDQSGLFTAPDLIPNPEEYIANFTMIIPPDGLWEFELPEELYLIATSRLRAFAFLNGKSASDELIVVDVTPPVAEAVDVYAQIGDAVPLASEFVTNVRDSNPFNETITTTYSNKNTVEEIANFLTRPGNYPVYIYITDEAGNSAEILSQLIVTKQLEITYLYNYQNAPNGGTFKHTTAEYGEILQIPAEEPERPDYNFTGWHTLEVADELFDFLTPVTTDLTIYAGWAPEINFEFIKTDELLYTDATLANPVEGVIFELYSLDYLHNRSLHQRLVSHEDGGVNFEELTRGETYHLVEISTINGFLLPDGYWIIEIDESDEITITAVGHLMPAFLEQDGNYYVGNFREFEIPILGGLGIHSRYFITGSVLIAVAGAIFVKSKKPFARGKL